MADNLTPAQRSYCMSRVRSRDTTPELKIRRLLHAQGLRFRKHVSTVPGRPDLVFPGPRVAVFIDGEFWHGYRYPSWKHSLSDFWRTKIEANRARDRRNQRRLRVMGWSVLRIWEHEVDRDPHACAERIRVAVRDGSDKGSGIDRDSV